MAIQTSPTLVFAELAPHALHVLIVSGKKVVACHAFRPEAKADIAAFVAEHKIAGLVRASIFGDRIFLHRSTESEASSIRQLGALQDHLASLPHGFEAKPLAVVCDTVTGLAPDASSATPWLLSVYDANAFATLGESLGELGLAPANVVLAAPAHIAAVIGAIAKDETTLVVIPGLDEAWLVWVDANGVKGVSSAPLGYTQIFESVQKGLGLKFRAAAGKLFFNDTYDFSEACVKICEHLVPPLKTALEGHPAASIYLAGFASSQAWFGAGLASALGLKFFSPSGSSVAGRLGMDAGGVEIPFSAAALLHVAAASSSSSPWVQPSLDNLIAQSLAKPKTAIPFVATKSVVNSENPAAESAVAPAAIPGNAAKPVAKSAAVAPVIKPAIAPKPAPKPVLKPTPKAIPTSVVAVTVEENATPAPSTAKRSKAPVFIAAGVGVVVALVGMGLYMRSPKSGQRNVTPTPVETTIPAPTVVTPTPAAPVPAPAPIPSPVPAPAPVALVSNDLLANEGRKYGNKTYHFEVSDKGFIQSLSTARDEILVESIGGISLQGSYVGTDGRRKWFNVGGVDDVGYVATVRKSIIDGNTVFEVAVQHPRFSVEQTYVCLPDSVKVMATFKALNLRDPRGAIAAVHSVRMAPVAINPSLRMRASDNVFIYSLKQTLLRVQFENIAWARDGAGGMQSVIAGETGVGFHFTENTDAARNTLKYEIQLGAN
ncbi:MAG: hypothetical protein RIQ79_666 [Verrucomicrobiota bacterium]|jgi:hypothetical protein